MIDSKNVVKVMYPSESNDVESKLCELFGVACLPGALDSRSVLEMLELLRFPYNNWLKVSPASSLRAMKPRYWLPGSFSMP